MWHPIKQIHTQTWLNTGCLYPNLRISFVVMKLEYILQKLIIVGEKKFKLLLIKKEVKPI